MRRLTSPELLSRPISHRAWRIRWRWRNGWHLRLIASRGDWIGTATLFSISCSAGERIRKRRRSLRRPRGRTFDSKVIGNPARRAAATLRCAVVRVAAIGSLTQLPVRWRRGAPVAAAAEVSCRSYIRPVAQGEYAAAHGTHDPSLPTYDRRAAIEHAQALQLRHTHEGVVDNGVVDGGSDARLYAPPLAVIVLEVDAVLEVGPARLAHHPVLGCMAIPEEAHACGGWQTTARSVKRSSCIATTKMPIRFTQYCKGAPMTRAHAAYAYMRAYACLCVRMRADACVCVCVHLPSRAALSLVPNTARAIAP